MPLFTSGGLGLGLKNLVLLTSLVRTWTVGVGLHVKTTEWRRAEEQQSDSCSVHRHTQTSIRLHCIACYAAEKPENAAKRFGQTLRCQTAADATGDGRRPRVLISLLIAGHRSWKYRQIWRSQPATRPLITPSEPRSWRNVITGSTYSTPIERRHDSWTADMQRAARSSSLAGLFLFPARRTTNHESSTTVQKSPSHSTTPRWCRPNTYRYIRGLLVVMESKLNSLRSYVVTCQYCQCHVGTF